MPRQRTLETFPSELKRRKEEIERELRAVSGSKIVILKVDKTPTASGESRVVFTQAVRIRLGGFHLHLREDFRDIDTGSVLYAFKYFLSPPDDISGKTPLFRYECHPDVDDQVMSKSAEDLSDAEESFKSHYGYSPHFHPDDTTPHPISHLHYPFHRSERNGILFALLEWIKVDLIRRYYESGRVKSR